MCYSLHNRISTHFLSFKDVSKKPSSNPLLIQLVNSVNKLIYQHAADIREVQKDIKKLDEDIKQLKNKQGKFLTQ